MKLEELGFEIAEKWNKLGRRLDVSEPKLQEIHQAHELLSEKGYHMLLHWKQEQGSAATYQALYNALSHNLVQRQDLAEQFCCFDGNYSLFFWTFKISYIHMPSTLNRIIPPLLK